MYISVIDCEIIIIGQDLHFVHVHVPQGGRTIFKGGGGGGIAPRAPSPLNILCT